MNSTFRVTNFENVEPETGETIGVRRLDDLKAYAPQINAETRRLAKEKYDTRGEELQTVSLTEMIVFTAEGKTDLLEDEAAVIGSNCFGWYGLSKSDSLVEFYTGLPNDERLTGMSDALGYLLPEYRKWEPLEKRGFKNHTLMTLMKLRLNMTDQELADRFRLERYVVNMTLGLWIPALCELVYRSCEDYFAVPLFEGVRESFTKVFDVVQICFEKPSCGTSESGEEIHTPHYASLAVKHNGYVCYASKPFGARTSHVTCAERSEISDKLNYVDVVLSYPEHRYAFNSYDEVSRLDMTAEGRHLLKEATERISVFRILQCIPTEYAGLSCHIFPLCAALSNILFHDDDASRSFNISF